MLIGQKAIDLKGRNIDEFVAFREHCRAFCRG